MILWIGVKGSPHSLALAQAVEEFNREGAQISALQRSLALAEFRHDRVGVVLELFVAGAGVHQRTGRKVVTARIVAAQFAVRRFPSSERLRRRGNAGIDSKGMQQSVRRQRMQILSVGLHRDSCMDRLPSALASWGTGALSRKLSRG